jgi:hypothetical protein
MVRGCWGNTGATDVTESHRNDAEAIAMGSAPKADFVSHAERARDALRQLRIRVRRFDSFRGHYPWKLRASVSSPSGLGVPRVLIE